MENINNYETTLTVAKKKKLGIFYTDQDLTRYIIERLKISENDKVIDPSCGNGAFIFGLKSYLKNSFKIENVFGIDLDKKVIDLLKTELKTNYDSKIIDTNFIRSDSINKNNSIYKRIKDGFDFIVGNPPYVNGKKNDNYDYKLFSKYINGSVNLSMLSLIRSLSFLALDGVLAFVMPKNFLHIEAYASIRKEVLENYTIEEILVIGSYFKEVRGEQIVIFIRNRKPSSGSKISLRYLIDKKKFIFEETIVKQDLFIEKNKIIIYRNVEEIEIIKKLEKNSKTLDEIVEGRIFRGIPLLTKNPSIKIYRGRDIEKFGVRSFILGEPKSIVSDQEKIKMLKNNKIIIQNIFSSECGIIGSYVDENYLTAETVTNIIVDNENDGKYLLGLLSSKLLNYYLIVNIFNNSKMTMHTDRKYIGNIPIIIKEKEVLIKLVDRALTKKYDKIKDILIELDKCVYKIYGLKDFEIKIVEDNIKHIYSEEWW